MFYNIPVYVALITLELATIIIVIRLSEAPRRASVAITVATFAAATYLGVWISPARGGAAEDGLRPFLWFGFMNAVALVAIVITSRLKYGKPRSSS